MPSRWPRRLALSLCLAAVGTTTAAGTAVAAPADGPDAARYWTAERLAAAKPLEGKGTPAAPRVSAAGPPAGTPRGRYGDGIPMVGTFFVRGAGQGNTYCTASVIRSPGRDLVLTAAHCAKSLAGGTDRIFIPQFRQGLDANRQKFGAYPVQRVFIDPRYRGGTGPATDLDFAFVRLGANAQHAKVENRTGGLRLTGTPRWVNTVTVLGYPGTANPGQQAISCTVPTARLSTGLRQMQVRCAGYYNGVSGGPWISHYDAKARTGEVIGVVGGYRGGGNDANDDWVSYSPILGREAQDLYQDAVSGRTPARGPRPAGHGATLPGTARLWRNAAQLAAGDFTGDGREDLVVVWSDGEVSLYAGDGRGGFGREYTLARKDSAWRRAVAVTGGEFGGAGHQGLLVRWDNGKLSLFDGVGPKGLGRETTLAEPGSIWKHATQITAGAYNSGARREDVVVRWSDGELTLYSGVGPKGLGREHRLGKHDNWKRTVALTSGRFSGRPGADLAVRWNDGSLDVYAGTGAGGLGTRSRVQAPNAADTGNSTMVAGEFTGSGRANDLIVRWSNGETSRYAGTTGSVLGEWAALVSP
ncbi:trypsin-like serine protease [Streptomyces orinoci]|uniref:Trypsin-like serine protease n=1 Tax=Streptomyces orinoci TaxID=67339 RepID=A0ABV3JZK6_STRON|nr:trypsin-like serine protease [Streptomyces orinoci]